MSSCSASTPSRISQGQRLATCTPAPRVETLGASGDFTQVRLADGTTGWVKSSLSHHRRARDGAGQAARGGAGPQPRDHAGAGRGGRQERGGAAASASSRPSKPSSTPHAAHGAAASAALRSRRGHRREARAQVGAAVARPALALAAAALRLLAGIRHPGAARPAKVRRPQSLLNSRAASRALTYPLREQCTNENYARGAWGAKSLNFPRCTTYAVTTTTSRIPFKSAPPRRYRTRCGNCSQPPGPGEPFDRVATRVRGVRASCSPAACPAITASIPSITIASIRST